MAVDSLGSQISLAAATRDSRLVSWVVDLSARKLALITSKRQRVVVNDSFPKTLVYDRKDILMFGVYDGLL